MSMTVEEFSKAIDNGIEVKVTMKNVGNGKTCVGIKPNQNIGDVGIITVLESALSGVTGIDEAELGKAVRELLAKQHDAEVKAMLDDLFSPFEEDPGQGEIEEPKYKLQDGIEEFLDFVRNGKEEDVADFKRFLKETISELK